MNRTAEPSPPLLRFLSAPRSRVARFSACRVFSAIKRSTQSQSQQTDVIKNERVLSCYCCSTSMSPCQNVLGSLEGGRAPMRAKIIQFEQRLQELDALASE